MLIVQIEHDETPTATPGLLLPGEVMRRLNVSRNTLNRWDADGLLVAVRLPSGHRRYRAEEVQAIERGEVSA